MALDKLSDLHMHSTYSDGKGSIDEMIQSAIAKGLKKIAFADHMPLPFPDYAALPRNKLDDYRAEVREAKERFAPDIEVLLGLELDYIPQIEPWIREIIALGWDYLISSVHFLFGRVDGKPIECDPPEEIFDQLLRENYCGDARTMCSEFYQMVQQGAALAPGSTIGHFDRIKLHNRDHKYFDENSQSYRDIIKSTLVVIREYGCKLEINTSGLDRSIAQVYPSPWIIDLCRTRDIPLVLGSDAHLPSQIARHFYQFAPLSPPNSLTR